MLTKTKTTPMVARALRDAKAAYDKVEAPKIKSPALADSNPYTRKALAYTAALERDVKWFARRIKMVLDYDLPDAAIEEILTDAKARSKRTNALKGA